MVLLCAVRETLRRTERHLRPVRIPEQKRTASITETPLFRVEKARARGELLT